MNWIKASEHLPLDERYPMAVHIIATVKQKYSDTPKVINAIARRLRNGETLIEELTMAATEYTKEELIAWFPWPIPYKEHKRKSDIRKSP